MPPQTTLLAPPYHDAYERLRVAVKSWLVQSDRISPGSPDYAERLEELYTRNGVADAFWELDSLVRGINSPHPTPPEP